MCMLRISVPHREGQATRVPHFHIHVPKLPFPLAMVTFEQTSRGLCVCPPATNQKTRRQPIPKKKERPRQENTLCRELFLLLLLRSSFLHTHRVKPLLLFPNPMCCLAHACVDDATNTHTHTHTGCPTPFPSSPLPLLLQFLPKLLGKVVVRLVVVPIVLWWWWGVYTEAGKGWVHEGRERHAPRHPLSLARTYLPLLLVVRLVHGRVPVGVRKLLCVVWVGGGHAG